MIVNETIKKIFVSNRKCIINTDLDGIISGMLLQTFLNWEVVGFSSCCGRPNDDLWIEDKTMNLQDCVFVDLPVCVDDLLTIDQHFVAFDRSSIEKYNSTKNKINPNIIRERMFKNDSGNNEYTGKYPFGTAHFILAVLEDLNLISSDFAFDFKKNLGGFDLADLILRADRVIGNTYQYTPNCIDWANWIMNVGGTNTSNLFNLVKNEYKARVLKEPLVESKLTSLRCGGKDGDCSNLFRAKDYASIREYFKYLSNCLELEPIPIFEIVDYGKLYGERMSINYYNFDVIKDVARSDNMFSYAFVNMKMVSLTYVKKD